MTLIYKILTVLIVVILLISLLYVIFSTEEEIEKDSDNKSPRIDFVTGDTTGTTGKITTIEATFSDNVNVTKATLYYKAASAETWSDVSILSGSADIEIPSNSAENWYYYVVVDDEAGNGPVGDPSVDGSVFYIIDVKRNIEDLVHNVFIEEATATWCNACPKVAKILHDLEETGEFNFYYVSMIEDMTDDDNNLASQRLLQDYNRYGLPSVFIDGGYEVIAGGNHDKSVYEEAIKKAMKRDAAKIDINVTAEYDENKEIIETSVKITNYENEVYKGRLKLYLTEIISPCINYGGKPYHYSLLDYIIDKNVEIPSEDEIEISEIYDSAGLDVDNLMAIAVVFNSESTKKYSNPPDGNPFDAYFADASDATTVVEGGNLPPEVGITNIEQGKLHFLGKPLFKTLLGNTILIGRITICVYSHDDLKVEKVELYIDNKLVDTCTEESYECPWECKWNEFAFGRHTVKVVSYDGEGKTATDSIEVIVIILLGWFF